MTKDRIYDTAGGGSDSFKFDPHVAAVFADMIERSVPGYGLTLEMIGVIAQQYGQPSANVYDLGCSLGASTLALRHNLLHRENKIIAIDNSPAMIDKCRINVDRDQVLIPVQVLQQDILETDFERASISVMNFTLQFINVEQRATLLQRISAATRAGGIFILSEKVCMPDDNENAALTNLHHKFKSFKGYSDLEISRKRSALEEVLVPESVQQHRERLLAAGFSSVYLWFQCFTFVSIIAIK